MKIKATTIGGALWVVGVLGLVVCLPAFLACSTWNKPDLARMFGGLSWAALSPLALGALMVFGDKPKG